MMKNWFKSRKFLAAAIIIVAAAGFWLYHSRSSDRTVVQATAVVRGGIVKRDRKSVV